MSERTRVNSAKYRDAPDRLVKRILAQREITPDGCWLWSEVQPDGYGHISYSTGGRRARKTFHLTVHRLIYMRLVGDPGDTMVLDHMCHDPDVCKLKTECPHRRCCNPAHLKPVTQAENLARSHSASSLNKIKTHCDQGHEFTAANTYIAKDGSRICRECKRLWTVTTRTEQGAAGRAHRAAQARARLLARKLTESRFCVICGVTISHRSRRAIYCESCARDHRRELQGQSGAA